MFAVMGDFNDLNTEAIERQTGLNQIVPFPTRGNNILDKILTNVSELYHPPEKHSALGKSDHCVVIVRPINQIPKPASRRISVRPLKDSCIRSFGQWITGKDWCDFNQAMGGSEMASELENILQHQYISHFNKCLQEGVFPTVWKTAAIIPVPKVPKPQTANDLRPIALTPIFGRVFESFLARWLREDFEPELDPQQYGNVKGISTSHYLVDLLNDTIKDLESPGTFSTLCAIDFTKAFDRINHTVAIHKIIDSGVRSSIIPTISSFLSDRNQCVKLQGHLSDPKSITCGVPQGTKCGPIIFTIVVNDAAITADKRWKFVDDLTLGETINVKKAGQGQLQQHLDALSKWCNHNDMLPKPSKCHIMHVSFLKNFHNYPTYTLSGETLETVDNMKLLGLHIQQNLKWDKQVENMIKRASRRFYLLYMLRGFGAPVEDLLAVYQTYIRPLVEYASPVWHPAITQEQSRQIEMIQKRSCRLILGNRYEHYNTSLADLNLAMLSDRREQLLLKFGQKLLNSERHQHLIPRRPDSVYALRTSKKYQEPRSRTDRYSRSTIPHIIRLLNQQ